jgi:cell shape-determining protein MreC
MFGILTLKDITSQSIQQTLFSVISAVLFNFADSFAFVCGNLHHLISYFDFERSLPTKRNEFYLLAVVRFSNESFK